MLVPGEADWTAQASTRDRSDRQAPGFLPPIGADKGGMALTPWGIGRMMFRSCAITQMW